MRTSRSAERAGAAGWRVAAAVAGWWVAAAAAAAGAALLVRLRRAEAAAEIDPLTGLSNRRGLARRWALGPPATAVLFVDLIGFKRVNDRLGHHAGDRLLADVAARLGAALGPGDQIGRWGGDEFLLLTRDPEALLDRLRQAMREPFRLEGASEEGVVIGFAAGVARPWPGAGLDDAAGVAARNRL